MQKSKNNHNVFINNVRIETQTVFNENGKINIFPCAFEENPHLVAHGNRASQKGRMITDDGTSCFSPYAINSGSRYNTLFLTPHGSVKETLHDVIFQIRFPKQLGKSLIENMLHDEQTEQLAFVKTRPSHTKWSE